MLLAVDPGLRGCGAALYEHGRLIACDHVLSGSKQDRAGAWVPMAQAVRAWVYRHTKLTDLAIAKFVVEVPVVYLHGPGGKKDGADPNDLIDLAAVVGALCVTFSEAFVLKAVQPREWKGQVPKEIHHARALSRLDADERARVPKLAKSRLHNALDALALGLTDLGRMR